MQSMIGVSNCAGCEASATGWSLAIGSLPADVRLCKIFCCAEVGYCLWVSVTQLRYILACKRKTASGCWNITACPCKRNIMVLVDSNIYRATRRHFVSSLGLLGSQGAICHHTNLCHGATNGDDFTLPMRRWSITSNRHKARARDRSRK